MSDEDDKCSYCGKECRHKTKIRKSKTNPMEVDVDVIDYHLECKRIHAKMEKINERIVKAKRKLHDLRSDHLNLEFKMFLKTMNQPDSDDDIQMVLTAQN